MATTAKYLSDNQTKRRIAKGEPVAKSDSDSLTVTLKGSISVDWAGRDSVRARMRVMVKRILRKYGYPPDLQDAAVQKVLQHAEGFSADWSESDAVGVASA